MEFSIPVNDILPDEISKVNSMLTPPGCHQHQGDVRTVRTIQESLGKLIDSLGEQSASAQGLSKAITTAEKLRNAPTHVLYLLKDASAKNGDGEIIGFLKVSHKHLYLFDERDKVREVEPLCVLDFFVSGARQRRGNGKRLFDYMLQDTGSRPQDLAIDGPSSKMETFLAKNYGVDHLIRQSNNFAVSPAFFITSPDANNTGRNLPVMPAAAVGRFTARKPRSSISDVIHGATVNRVYNNGTPEDTPAPAPEPPKILTPEPEPEPQPEPIPEVPKVPASPSPERPTTLQVAPAVSAAPSPAGSAAPRRDSQLTDQGYFDVKFYHNKLW
ncbi:alpha-tubulin N-acetyltransferase 1 isoform X1 [Cydia strobilella]|uniref:alpha-tubulin N-acetyltransferase 1 isoform X1 n=1 Tax=Cydia strobilella TaxID=1100964 RepID=UPI003005FCEE